jgi:hypothetical protein
VLMRVDVRVFTSDTASLLEACRIVNVPVWLSLRPQIIIKSLEIKKLEGFLSLFRKSTNILPIISGTLSVALLSAGFLTFVCARLKWVDPALRYRLPKHACAHALA